MVVEGDPDLVLLGERGEALGLLVVALGGDGLAAQGLGDLEVEVDVVVGRAERELVDVDVDAGVVVHLAQLLALGKLRLAQLGAVGIAHRGRCRLLGVVARAAAPATSAPAAASNPRERADGSVHQLRLAQAILQEALERVLGGVHAAAIAVGDAADSHAAQDGVGLGSNGAEDAARHDRARCQGGCAAEKCPPCREMIDEVLRHVRLLQCVWLSILDQSVWQEFPGIAHVRIVSNKKRMAQDAGYSLAFPCEDQEN